MVETRKTPITAIPTHKRLFAIFAGIYKFNMEKDLFLEAGQKMEGAMLSQMFGKPCFKVNGKAFTCFYEDCMVFKLGGKTHAEALSLNNAELFDPSGKKRPMKEWVQVPAAQSAKWKKFTKAAYDYVKNKSD
jgi:hypothetical protein